MEIRIVEETTSTNTALYEEGLAGRRDDCMLVAFRQTNGKGRRGRDFYSPVDTGLYLSIFLHTEMEVSKAMLLTPLMAVAASEAVEKYIDDSMSIKWVNDLYYKDKKVSGILTESSPLTLDGKTEFVVIGIGLNLFEPEGGFPEDIKNRAGAIFYKNIKNVTDMSHNELVDFKKELAQVILERFEFWYSKFPDELPVEEYRKRSYISSRWVQILDGPEVFVEGISDDFGLAIQYKNGSKNILKAGEVSLVL